MIETGDWQQEFVAALLSPSRPPPTNLDHPMSGHAASARFDIYRNNVMHSLQQVLADSFPRLQKLLGAELFIALAENFIRHKLPETPMVADYGRDLPEFMLRFEPLQDVPYAVDVARLEWALLACAQSADHVVMLAEDLLADDIQQKTLHLAPSLAVLESSWPLYDIWRFIDDEAVAPTHSEAQHVLIYRDVHFEARVVHLPRGGVAFMAALIAAQPLARAAEDSAQEGLTQDGLQYLMTLLVHEQQIVSLEGGS